MALQLSLDYRLRWLDFDRYGHIQPVTVLDLMQDIATLQAEEMGIGRDHMLQHGVVWVLTRIKYEVVKEPHRFQTVTVRTWPHTPTRFSFLRDFDITDEHGDQLIKATSEWVLMNLETRKFAKMGDVYDGPMDFIEDRAFEQKPRKLASFEEDNRPLFVVTPAFCDIDLNEHVNNARYPSFAMNALNLTEEAAIVEFQIDYRHEALPDEPLIVYTRVEDGLVQQRGMREDGQVAFACAMKLAKR